MTSGNVSGRAGQPPMVVCSPAGPGDRVGPWELERVIGQGSTAVVFSACHVDLNHRVALKLLREGAIESPAARMALYREAQFLASVRHPNLPSVYDAGAGRHGPWFIMELFEGATLADHLLRAGALSVEETVGVGLALLSALVCIHSAGAVHADVKASNILLVEGLRPSGVRLIDLGAAHWTGAEAAIAMPEAPQGHHGTPGYMPPEQSAGQPLTAQADLYSVGVVLRRCLPRRIATADAPIRSLLHAACARERSRRPMSALSFGDTLAIFASPRDRAWWIHTTAAHRSAAGAGASVASSLSPIARSL